MEEQPKVYSAYYIDSKGRLVYCGFPVLYEGLRYEDFQPGAKWPFHGRRPRYKWEVWGVDGREPEDIYGIDYWEGNETYLCHGAFGAVGIDGTVKPVTINKRLGLKHVLKGDTFAAFDYWEV